MAAAEYYGKSAQELPGSHPTRGYPPQAQHQYQQPPIQSYSQPPPQYDSSYNLASQPQQQQLQTYPPPPPPPQNARPTPPYPTGPPPYFAPPPTQSNYLDAPLQPHRSHSQPPRVHFAEQESDRSLSDSYSDSDDSTRPRHGHRHHHQTRDLGRAQRREHKDRDTFLGAGAGALVGDVIFPGLGTAAGILLGGLGGRKYAKRSKSEDTYSHSHRHRDAYYAGKEEASRDIDSRRRGGDIGHRHRDAYHEGKEEGRRRRDGNVNSDSEDDFEGRRHGHGRRERGYGVRRHGKDEGWDEKSATFKSGTAIR
jgi:hypothetical protein